MYLGLYQIAPVVPTLQCFQTVRPNRCRSKNLVSHAGPGGLSRQALPLQCLKVLGNRINARAFERSVTEIHIRVALLNRF